MINLPQRLPGLLSGIPWLQMGLMDLHARGKLHRNRDGLSVDHKSTTGLPR